MRTKTFALAVTIAAVVATLAMPASARKIADSTGVNPLHGVVGEKDQEREKDIQDIRDQINNSGGSMCGLSSSRFANPTRQHTQTIDGNYGWRPVATCQGIAVASWVDWSTGLADATYGGIFGYFTRPSLDNCPSGYKFAILSSSRREDTVGGIVHDSTQQVTSYFTTATCVRQ